MPEYTYSIIMDTQLGPKHGTILLKIEGNKIEGNMYILKNEQSIHGELLGGGMCRFYGRIVTLMRILEYTAEGYFDDKKIEFTLHGQRDDFHVSGIASPSEKGEAIDEKIL